MLIMKKQNRIIGFLSLAIASSIAMFSSCNKDPYEIGDAYSKVEGLDGQWEVATVSIIDEQSVLKDEIDLTSYYTSDPANILTITFSATEMTYEVEEGEGINYFGANGAWQFDDPNYPAYLYLIFDTETGLDTTELLMGSTINEYQSQMALKYPRNCGEALVSSYQFNFNRK